MTRWKNRRWSTAWGLFVAFVMVFTLMVQAAPAHAIVRGYTVTKKVVSSGPYTIGSEVEFKITVSVRRDGDWLRPRLRNVVVNDPMLGLEDHSLGTIRAGNSKSVTGKYVIQEGDPNPLVNTAKVTGEYCHRVGQVPGSCDGKWKPFTENPEAEVEWEEPQEPEPEPEPKKPKGTLIIKKVDEKKKPLGGATFEVCRVAFGPDDCTEVKDNDDEDQDERDGFIKLTGLKFGTYKIRETVAPDGYQGSNNKETVLLTKTKRTRTVKFQNFPETSDPEPTGDLIIYKYDENQELLGGANFRVCPVDGTGGECFDVKDNEEGGLDEDETEGVIRVTGLPAGSYEVTEIEAPPGYQISDGPKPAGVCVEDFTLLGFHHGFPKQPECDPAEVKFYNEPEEDDTPPPPPPGRTTRTPRVDLAVTKAVDDPTPGEGQQVIFTITVTNEGPDDASNVVYRDLIPAGLTYVSHDASQGTYDPVSGEWALGDLADGASATLTVTAIVNPGTAGEIVTNTVTLVSSSPNDTNSSNNSASASVAPPQVVQVEEEPPAAEPPAGEAPPLPVTGGNALHLVIPGLLALGAGLYLRRRWA